MKLILFLVILLSNSAVFGQISAVKTSPIWNASDEAVITWQYDGSSEDNQDLTIDLMYGPARNLIYQDSVCTELSENIKPSDKSVKCKVPDVPPKKDYALRISTEVDGEKTYAFSERIEVENIEYEEQNSSGSTQLASRVAVSLIFLQLFGNLIIG